MSLTFLHKELTKIQNLPTNLIFINYGYNNITEIQNLPHTLQYFGCYCNKIKKIKNLPNSLQIFQCNQNEITKIENLPSGLKEFHYKYNPIQYVDNISINWFNERGGFNLKWYNNIKYLQRRIKLRFKKKDISVRIIQKGCHNWLYKPLCNDGTIGIVPRLFMKQYIIHRHI